jgi:hypothetical protein
MKGLKVRKYDLALVNSNLIEARQDILQAD